MALAVLDGGRLASGGFKPSTITIWELATGTCISTLEGHQGCLRAVKVLQGGLLASGADDGAVMIWDLASCTCLATLYSDHENSDYEKFSLEVLEDGRLASGGFQCIELWSSALSGGPAS